MGNRRDRIPGVGRDGERTLQTLLTEINDRLDKLERKEGRALVVEADTAAKVGEFLNVEAPSDGLTIILPQPKPALRNARITLNFRNANPVRITSILGLVNRESFVISTAIGTFEAVCDGIDGWSVETGVSSSGSAIDAEYILGSAHGSLPNGAVGSDTTSINFSYTPGGFATWDLNALTGAIETTANGVATRFRGIRTNGSLQTPRTHLNFLDTNTVTWTPADDAGNDEWEMRATARAGNVRDNGSLETPQVFVNYLDGPSIQLRVTQDAGNQELEVQASYVGTTSAITLTGSTGNLGTIDISALECGGSVRSSAPAGDFQVEGFNRSGGNPDGFWFYWVSSNVEVLTTFFEEDGTATTTDRIRSANGASVQCQAPHGIFYYAQTRWRYVGLNNADAVQRYTTAGLTSNLALNPSTQVLQIDTGNSAWSIDGIAGGYAGRKLIIQNASNTSSTGTLVTGANSVSSAANQFITPENANRGGYHRYCALLEYDGVDSVWRIIADTYLPVMLEREESGAGPFDPLTRPLNEKHVMMTNAGTVNVLGMTAGAFRGDFAVTTAQAGRHIFEDNTATASTQRFAIPGDVNAIIGDTEQLLWCYLDDSSSSDAPRWMLMNRTFPFFNTTVNIHRDKIAHNGTNFEVTQSLRKSQRVCEFWEDFEALLSREGLGTPALDTIFDPILNGVTQKQLFFGQTQWGGFGSGEVSSCTIDHLEGETNHPGVVRFTTSSADNDFGCIFRGTAPDDGWIAGQDIRVAETCFRLTTVTSVAFFFGFCEDLVDALTVNATANSNIIGFIYDTDNASFGGVNANWHTITREADGTAVITNTGVAVAFGWDTYEIRQETLGTIQFYINDVLVATHTTQVPDTETMNFGIHHRTRTTASRVVSLDYIGFESRPLDRTAG